MPTLGEMVEISTLADDGLIGTEVEVAGSPATRAIRKVNAFKLTVDNTVFVDATNGDDASGLRERPDKPFATLNGAYAVAQNFDTIQVLPGTYDETVGSVKQLIWYFHKGAEMNYTGGGLSPLISGSSTGLFEIRGYGKFTTNASTAISYIALSNDVRCVIEVDEIVHTYAGAGVALNVLASTSAPIISVRVNKVTSTTDTAAVLLSGSNVTAHIGSISYTGTGTALSVGGGASVLCDKSISSSAGHGITVASSTSATTVEYRGTLSVTGAGKAALYVGTGASAATGVHVRVYGVLSSTNGNAVEIVEGGATLDLNRAVSNSNAIIHSGSTSNYTNIRINSVQAPTGLYASSGFVRMSCTSAICPTQFVYNFGATVDVANDTVTSPLVVSQTTGAITGRFNTVVCSGIGVYITQGSSNLTFNDLVVTGSYAATWPDILDGNHVLRATNLSGPSGAINVNDPFGSLFLVDVAVANTISSAGTVINAVSTQLNVKADTISGGRITARAGSTVVIEANEIQSIVTASGNAELTVRNANISVHGVVPVQLPNGEGDGQRLVLSGVVVDGGTNACFLGEGNNTAIFRDTVLVSSSGTVAAGTGDAYYYGVYANGATANTLTVQVDDSVVSGAVIG